MTLKEIANALPIQPSRKELVEALGKAYAMGIADSIKTAQAAAEVLEDGESKAVLQALILGLTIGKNYLVEVA